MDTFDTILNLAIAEDLGENGDVTSRAIFSGERAEAQLFSKDSGIMAGQECLIRTYNKINPEVKITFRKEDGDSLQPGDGVARIEGPVVSILEGERIAINFMSFLSGIATQASRCVKALSGSRAVILDTRKTLPGYRSLSKYAVVTGGAKNHRMGLFDMVMIKDNHIDAAGSITAAVSRVRDKWDSRFRIEVETRNAAEVREALDAGADIIMLDNMNEEDCARAVRNGAGRALFEASGNMNLQRIARYSGVGVDSISVGALTHSVKAFDYSMRISIGG